MRPCRAHSAGGLAGQPSRTGAQISCSALSHPSPPALPAIAADLMATGGGTGGRWPCQLLAGPAGGPTLRASAQRRRLSHAALRPCALGRPAAAAGSHLAGAPHPGSERAGASAQVSWEGVSNLEVGGASAWVLAVACARGGAESGHHPLLVTAPHSPQSSLCVPNSCAGFVLLHCKQQPLLPQLDPPLTSTPPCRLFILLWACHVGILLLLPRLLRPRLAPWVASSPLFRPRSSALLSATSSQPAATGQQRPLWLAAWGAARAWGAAALRGAGSYALWPAAALVLLANERAAWGAMVGLVHGAGLVPVRVWEEKGRG